jgi:hypothetical protein
MTFFTVLYTCFIVTIFAAILVVSYSGHNVEGKSQCLAYNCKTVACDTEPQFQCYTAFNVNTNQTTYSLKAFSYPNTTVDYNNGCHTDMVTQTQNILKEKQQNPAMYKSDAKMSTGIDIGFWCGIEK